MNRIKAAHGMDGKRHQLREEVYETPDQTIGQLNPQFVAWLMGYPLAWTDTRADLQVSLTRE